ncbi:MAG: lipopolysaccharide core heptose(I) kinase RfaP, partial [Planctomycetota bacterium]|nr:lipopolysaccharide core heptose(I) kinase RfaP [Planctomycetota bacterium]
TSRLAPGIVELAPPITQALEGQDAFKAIMNIEGDVYRHHKNRRTVRAKFGNKRFFIKAHGPSGWKEIIKNLFRMRLPVLTGQPEYEAIRRLNELGVRTMTCAGFGLRGRNPAQLNSFVITEALEDFSDLEQLAPSWKALPDPQRLQLKRAVIREIASMARTLHTEGLNHRDFYICHFMTRDRDWNEWTASDGLDLHLIDLHRMQIRGRTPLRWLIKDLSGLLFSVLDLDLSSRDYMRFLRVYWGKDWKRSYRRTRLLRQIIVARAVTLYRRKQGKRPHMPRGLASFS